MNPYTYEPLDLAGREIRLIEIQPSAQFSAQVKCKVIKARLEDAPKYFALSYCWGDQTNPICIRLNGHMFPVGVNLYLALRRLRMRSGPVVFWVNAICIDQANIQERGQQVSMMRAIYEGAQSVAIWLGELAAGSALAMGSIRTWAVRKQHLVDDLKGFLLEHPASFKPRSWKAMDALFLRPWWYRVWVYQEIVVSRDAIFVCGPDFLHWKYWLFAIINWNYLSKPDILPLLDAQHRKLLTAKRSINLLVSRMLVHRFVKFPGQEDVWRHFDLLHLAELTQNLDATDPRDKIYALLGVDEVQDIYIDPDYTKSTSEVYRDFVIKYIQTRHDLSIICKGGIGTVGFEESFGLPSWIPDFRCSKQKSVIQVSSRLTNFTTSKSCRSVYSCCFGSQTLSARGLVCDVVAECRTYENPCSDIGPASYYIQSKVIGWSELALVLAKVPHPTGTSQYQAFPRTIIEDGPGHGYGRPESRDEDDHQEFFSYVIGFLVVVGEAVMQAAQTDSDLEDKFIYWNGIHARNTLWAKFFALWSGALLVPDISNLSASDKNLMEPFLRISGSNGNLRLPETFSAGNDEEYAARSFVRRVNGKLDYRNFFVSSKGYMGLSPLGTKVGDEICVLLGCSQPLVVRRVGDHHLVVGQCYVYGMMFGEMMDEMEAGRLKAETFHFK
jgi:hypothetical protein